MRLLSLSPFAFSQLLCFATALNTGTILTSDIDTFVADILREWNSPAGVAVAVVRQDGQGGWAVETKGYGTAKSDGTKVTPDTLFSIGSESKLFNILATGLLISNKSLDTPVSWTTKIASIIPEWGLMDPIASSGSSIIDLMSHRTGMPRHDATYGLSDTVPAIIKRLKYLEPSAEFRSKFQYNNLMYTVLSYLPTVLHPSKPSLAQYVQENIFEPLGMNSTTYSFQRANATNMLAESFGREGDPTTNPLLPGGAHAMPFWLQVGDESGSNFASGPGGVISSINDIAIWLQMLISNGVNPATNATVIPADVLETVTSGITVYPFTEDFPELSVSTYGGGQYKSNYRGHDLIEHGGDIQGFHSAFTRFPFEGVGVAILSNDDLFYIRDIIRYRVMDELFGLEPFDWNTRYRQVAVETALARASLVSTPRPANATPPTGGFSSLVGNYSNPGYTSFELCQLVPPPSSASQACSTLAQSLNASFPALIDYTVPTLVFTWDRIASQYMKLAHFEGDIFNLTGWTGMPTGNASSPIWAYDAGLSSTNVEFGAGTANGTFGFGFVGGVWGAQDSPDPQGTTAEERAEVWFTKGAPQSVVAPDDQ
ncbi:beta-lactamase/transpeptidase-like protein [Mycena albidolilacea]|uniref:Beta-lactamase/transpeptidase-like protein n=1 Tax=Mycena albidolilacea TaxID=1033008 RepID=A0AAD7E9K7_9AGAR|nr:beta-lactamase/transpeptidase-like protein [Mycena albidolilacea]